MLAGIGGIGPSKYSKIIEHYRSCDELSGNGKPETLKECGLTDKLIDKINGFNNWAKIDEAIERAEKSDIKIICQGNPDYPELLTNIYSPPIVLYVKGDTELLHRPSVAIVGSRTPTTYGRSMAEKLSAELASSGLIIVSGLAMGIDTHAHKAALDIGGYTGAIFGNGIDIVYPNDNRKLAERVSQNGFCLSEFPFGTPPEKFNFPRRNRIISGLSLAVVVVEAAARSGALVTANIAAEQGKDVFAVPGPADSPKSDGTIKLIKDGAYVATCAEDILQNLGWDVSGKSSLADKKTVEIKVELEPEEQRVCDMITTGPLHFDELVRNLNLPTSKLSGILLKLELAGLITRRPGNYLARM